MLHKRFGDRARWPLERNETRADGVWWVWPFIKQSARSHGSCQQNLETWVFWGGQKQTCAHWAVLKYLRGIRRPMSVLVFDEAIAGIWINASKE